MIVQIGDGHQIFPWNFSHKLLDHHTQMPPRLVLVAQFNFKHENIVTHIQGFRAHLGEGRRAYPVIHSQAPCLSSPDVLYLFICLCRGFSCMFSDNAWHVLNCCQQAWTRRCSRWFMRIWCCSPKDTGSEDIKDLQSLDLFTKVSNNYKIWTHLSGLVCWSEGFVDRF